MTFNCCWFREGTRILTETGETAAEALKTGDDVVTIRANGPATQPIVQTGRRKLNLSRHPNPLAVTPVRIHANAFAPGMPARDLWLSPNHAIYIDGALFEANALCNGVTIHQEPAVSVVYIQLVLAAHDVLLAEGLPAGSSLVGDAVALFPDLRAPVQAPLCLPVVREGELLREAQNMLRYRAGSKQAVLF